MAKKASKRVTRARRGPGDPTKKTTLSDFASVVKETLTEAKPNTRSRMIPSFQELEAGIKIDKHALEEECRVQSEMFYHVASELALMISRRDYAAQDVKDITAQVDTDTRADLARDESVKVTEATIAAHVRSSSRVIEANNEFLFRQKRVNEWTALKEAYQQRNYMLKELVALYLSNYYSANPDTPGTRAMRDVVADRSREAMQRAREQRNDRNDADSR